MKKALHILFIAAVSLLCSSCEKPPLWVPLEPTPTEKAIETAGKIVSDPSNWKENTKLLTELGNSAQDIGIEHTQEFKDFDLAAQDLIRFGTTWIDSLDEGIKTQLRNELSSITSQTKASLGAQVPLGGVPAPVGVGAQAKINTTKDAEKVESDAERVIFTTIKGLRAAQADEFGKLFARAQTTYRALRLVLQPPRNP